jgi:hypothetical protein
VLLHCGASLGDAEKYVFDERSSQELESFYIIPKLVMNLLAGYDDATTKDFRRGKVCLFLFSIIACP